MTSKIINMAEKLKDAEDRLLESLFAAEPLEDDGFSAQVIGRIQRRLWLRRLILPVAAVFGGLIAFRPMADLVSALAGLSSLLPPQLVETAQASLPQFSTLVMGGALLGICLIGMRVIEE